MASFQHIFLVFALSLLTLCQVLGANTREEWIAALSRLPWLEDRYENALQNTLEEEDELQEGEDGDGPSVYFSYEPSFADPMDGSTYEPSSAVEGEQPQNGTSDLRMPNIHPEKANDYFCYGAQMPRKQGVYLVGFSPVTTQGTAHHILLYGCKEPGFNQEQPWDCGEMDMVGSEEKKLTAPPCSTGSKILYAWAMDAPPLELPKDIGFEVGGDTGIDYLVLQVHYANVDKFKDGSTDDSGIALSWTMTPQPLKAGVYFMGTNGEIPAKSTDVHLEAACEYEGPIIHPFAYRVHTHKLGQVVSGYRIRDEFWTEIGKRSPQLPQMFNPISKDVGIQQGDTLAMRCTFASDRDDTTYIGMTGDDEMCNFYIMYYTSEGQLPEYDVCYRQGDYKWTDDLSNIPDNEASTLTSGASSNSM